ncbi:GFA family protein [Nitrincola sp. MINF-07-Sa-05]|uniref:GFA family protein n=1 Tax=Nitrincola salilacus TaxID=3400273 RepID=UPI0039182920
MDAMYSGSCLCGQVRFVVEGFSSQVANCHCSMCRKFHGAAFATLVSVSGLRWVSGESMLKHYTAGNGTVRSFCSECGSSLGFRGKNQPLSAIEIAISAFDEDIPVEVDAHIYTNYKACWHHIADELPAFGEGRE